MTARPFSYVISLHMDVLFIHGPAASGKHTIGTLLSTLLDLPLFHNHLVVDAVRALFDFGTEPFIQLREEMWLAAFTVAANASRSFIFTFNPEATVDASLIPRLQDRIQAGGGRILYVELTCSDEAVLERINNPGRAQFGKLLDGDVYLSSKAQGGFEFPALPEPIVVVDTETLAPIESARVIAQAYQAVGPVAGD